MGITKQREIIIQNETCWRTGNPRSYYHFVITDLCFSIIHPEQPIHKRYSWSDERVTNAPIVPGLLQYGLDIRAKVEEFTVWQDRLCFCQLIADLDADETTGSIRRRDCICFCLRFFYRNTKRLVCYQSRWLQAFEGTLIKCTNKNMQGLQLHDSDDMFFF